jgi:polyribonucleotide 5'-hydroxyl-kinase
VRRLEHPDPSLIHRLLAVIFCPANTPDAVLAGNVAGYVWVIATNPAERTVTVLSPIPGNIPSCVFVRGDITWNEG